MKYLVFFLLILAIPIPASAVYIINCDSKPHTILVLTEGIEGNVKLATGETLSESSPVFSFQVEGMGPVMLAKPNEQYSIVRGKLVRRLKCEPKNQPHIRNGILVN